MPEADRSGCWWTLSNLCTTECDALLGPFSHWFCPEVEHPLCYSGGSAALFGAFSRLSGRVFPSSWIQVYISNFFPCRSLICQVWQIIILTH